MRACVRASKGGRAGRPHHRKLRQREEQGRQAARGRSHAEAGTDGWRLRLLPCSPVAPPRPLPRACPPTPAAPVPRAGETVFKREGVNGAAPCVTCCHALHGTARSLAHACVHAHALRARRRPPRDPRLAQLRRRLVQVGGREHRPRGDGAVADWKAALTCASGWSHSGHTHAWSCPCRYAPRQGDAVLFWSVTPDQVGVNERQHARPSLLVLLLGLV